MAGIDGLAEGVAWSFAGLQKEFSSFMFISVPGMPR